MRYINWQQRLALQATGLAIKAQQNDKIWEAGTKFLARCRDKGKDEARFREDVLADIHDVQPMIQRGDGSYVRGQLLDEETAEQYGISIRSW